MIIIRLAVIADAPDLQRLLLQMGSHYQRTLLDIENRILSFELLARNYLFVAELEGKIVGVIAFGYYEQFRLQGCCCHIDTLIVDSTCRGLGIGKKLIEFAEADAKKMGATEIELTTANFRRAHGTHDFYHSLGYEDHVKIDCTYFAKQNLCSDECASD